MLLNISSIMVASLTDRIAQMLPAGATGVASLMLVFGLFILLSWFLCIAGAFANVREVKFTVGVIAMGSSLFLTFVFMGLCRTLLPDLAASFTPSGLFMVCGIMGSLLCAVPLVQYFWELSYLRSFSVVAGAVAIMITGYVAINAMMYPVDTLPARLAVPLVQDHQPWLK